MLDYYLDRPDAFLDGKYAIMDTICYAEFLAYYYVDYNYIKVTNDCQPTVLTYFSENLECSYPKTIPLMSSKKTLKCRNSKCVLRYHVPNKHIRPEEYAHHLLFMFYPFRDESDLLLDSSYVKKFGEVGVADVVNINKLKSEPYGDFVDQALLEFRASSLQYDACADEENAEVEALLNNEVNEIPGTSIDTLPSST